jgi:UDP-2,3-diacylglucosamine pyrophosphatase LpxH
MLNSQYYTSEETGNKAREQNEWLRNALNPFWMKPVHKFVFMHIPLFMKTPEDEDAYEIIPKEPRRQLLKMFKEAGVEYVIAGHNHANRINKYDGMQLITTASTSRILGDQEYGPGFRIFEVYLDRIRHYYVELDEPLQEVILYP